MNAAQLNDNELIRLTADGEVHAFECLYQRYEQRALGYIRRFVDDRAFAEEVLVDAMLSVWLGASEFRAGSRVSTWILGIARHRNRSMIAASKRPRGDTAACSRTAGAAQQHDAARRDASSRAQEQHAARHGAPE